MRYVFLISFDGTNFCGSQRQRERRTVQSVLEEAGEKVFSSPVRFVLSGRTDAGVHAAGQIAHLDGETSIPAHRLREALNRVLPDDVKVLASAVAPEGFDCTRNARKKRYCYRFYLSPCTLPLLERYAVRVEGDVDLSRMRRAAQLLIGEHDFAAFRATGSSAKTTVRRVYDLSVDRQNVYGAQVYEIRVTGNGFLYNMVRIIAGELYAIGCEKASQDAIERAFATGERSLLFRTMPAKGLTLEQVEFDVPLFGTQGENDGTI